MVTERLNMPTEDVNMMTEHRNLPTELVNMETEVKNTKICRQNVKTYFQGILIILVAYDVPLTGMGYSAKRSAAGVYLFSSNGKRRKPKIVRHIDLEIMCKHP